jgi:uncharacterized protein (TIGR02611 family)
MRKSTKVIRKFIVGLIGFPFLALGIVLIPLPGPGVLVCLLAFFILSLEFDWAEKYYNQAKAVLKKIYDKSKERMDKIDKK